MSQLETAGGQTPAAPVPRISPVAGVLSYLIPGLGQIAQGRVSKGVFFMIVLLGMFHAGQAMGGWKNVYVPHVDPDPGAPILRRIPIYYRWHFAGQFFIGVAAWPAIWQYYGMAVPPQETSPFLHNYQREPMTREKEIRLGRQRIDPAGREVLSGEGQLNREIARSDKSWDLGWVYTVVAGVLNILVIYDAAAGPAFGVRREKAAPQPEAATS